MAAHPNPQYPQRAGEPECRDYLRTGRCKYGESCKYNHPPNVQSGGGIRTPLDPSEPPFPIRPGEPPCQYYLKHGTCKFGQTCKFHHPPHVMTSAATGGGLGGPVMMNLINTTASHRGAGPQQIIALNSADGGTVAELQTQFLQLLPQRPTEPDCIYFLRNGRCKYGATCKYHHPIDGRQQRHRQQEHTYVQLGAGQARMGGRHRSSSAGSGVEAGGGGGYATVHLLPSHGVSHGSYGPRRSEPTHILVSDGPIRVMTINQNAPSRTSSSYQQASSGSSPLTTSTSVASSYETAASNLDFLTASASAQGQYHQEGQVQMDPSGRLWRRTGSQEHLRHGSGSGSPQSSRGDLQRVSSPQQVAAGVGGGGMLARVGSGDSEGGRAGQPVSSLRHVMDTARPRSTSFGESSVYSHSSEPNYSHGRGMAGSGWSSGAAVPSPGRGDHYWEEGHHTAFGQSQSYEGQSYEGQPGRGFLSSSAPEYYPDRASGLIPPPPQSLSGGDIDGARKRYSHPQKGHPAARHSGADDNEADGLSMMTSALLTMLDAPDGAPRDRGDILESVQEGAPGSDVKEYAANHAANYAREHPSSGPSTPRQSGSSFYRSLSLNEDSPRIGGDFLMAGRLSQPSNSMRPSSSTPQEYGGGTYASSLPSRSPPGQGASSGQSAAHLPSRGVAGSEQDERSPPHRSRSSGPSWSPTWQGAGTPDRAQGRQLERNAQSVSALQPSAGTPQHSHAPHGGGLFLR